MRKLLLVIFLLSFQNLAFISDFSKEEKKQTITESITNYQEYAKNKISYDSLYNEVIESIKEFEGLRLTAYLCPAQQKTIGYGHFVKPTDNLSETITIEQADSLLRKDFNDCINVVKKHIDSLNIDNKEVKTLALAHFIYNVGVGNFEKSTLLKLVKDNKPVDDELLKWIHYKYKDKDNNLVVVKSKYLKQIRQYEVDLFNFIS